MQIIDSISFPSQSTNVSYARIPNGVGSFVYNTPSFSYNNDFASIGQLDNLKFHCYPNPFKNHLNISLNNSNQTSISICDIRGKILKKVEIGSDNDEITLDTFPFKKGMYFVILENNKTIAAQKIIKY